MTAFRTGRPESTSRTTHSGLFLFLLLISWLASAVCAEDLNSCASINTGSGSEQHVSVFQTIGLCSQTCKGYAYGILQGKSCWCSNYTPGKEEDLDKCNDSCPGFPDDKCGSTKNGLFGYILLSTPSGTKGADSSSSASKTASSTKTSSGSVIKSTITGSASSAVSVMTITGKAPTQTITAPSASSTSSSDGNKSLTAAAQGHNTDHKGDDNDDDDKDGSFFDSKGKVAGTFSAVGIAGVGMIAAALFFILRRKKQDKHPEDGMGGSSGTGSPNSFFEGKLFKGEPAGVMIQRDQSTSTTLYGYGDEKTRHGRHAASLSNGDTIVPIPVDQRLDPGQVFMQWDNNESRRSLQDDHDYSRKVLRVTNPDS